MWLWTQRFYPEAPGDAAYIQSDLAGPFCAVVGPYGNLVEPGTATALSPPSSISFSRQAPNPELSGTIDLWFDVTLPYLPDGAYMCFDSYVPPQGMGLPYWGFCHDVSGWTPGTYEFLQRATVDRWASFSAFIVGRDANSPKVGPVSGTPTLGGWVPG